MKSKKPLIICGPTATGKTSLGLRLAEKLNGEIISADSRQVYWGMDIGTGKDLPEEAKLKIQHEKKVVNTENFKKIRPYRFGRMPVWLLDIVEPDEHFSVVDYMECAQGVVADLRQRNKLPVIVGGTGLYLKALSDGFDSAKVKPDWKLRQRLAPLSVAVLQLRLKKMAPERYRRMNESDRRNPRRLIRAIEKSLRSKGGKNETIAPVLEQAPLTIGLMAPRHLLNDRIEKRVETRVRQGLEAEIRSLLEKGYLWDNSVLGATLGYQQWQPFFKQKDLFGAEKKQLKKAILDQWKKDERAYARRQMTWFKKQKSVKWINIGEKNWVENLEKYLERCYHGKHVE